MAFPTQSAIAARFGPPLQGFSLSCDGIPGRCPGLKLGRAVGAGEHALEYHLGMARIGIILDNLSEQAYHLRVSPRAPTSLALSTDGSRTKHREAPMSFRANSRFAAEIPCYAAEIPCFRRNREFMSNGLMYQAIEPRGRPKKGKSGTILQIPC